MKRSIYLATSLFFCTGAGYAQDLAGKIPQKATVVATFKSDQFFQLLSLNEFNQSPLGKKIFEGLSERGDTKFSSLEDFGVNLKSSMYYYNHITDSITYNALLLPITDVEKFTTLLKKNSGPIIKKGNTRFMALGDSSAILMFNDNMAYFVKSALKPGFFSNPAAAERYGIHEQSYSAVDDAAEVTVDTVFAEMDTTAVIVEEEVTPPVEAEVAKDTTIEIIDEEEEKEDMNEYWEMQSKKNNLLYAWTAAYINDQFAKNNAAGSILSNASFVKKQNSNALANLWVSGIGDLYSGFLPLSATRYMGNFMNAYGNFNAQLFMDKEQLRVTGEIDVNQEMADAFQKIYKRKLNKKFAKYVNSDKAIGMFGFSFDSKAYLENMPKVMENAYGAYFGGGGYKEEFSMASDFLSLILDEKAMSDVLKGDFLFLLNDISEKTVTYKSYTYDDDFNRTEVEKTKQETLPDFLLMFSSDDTRLFEKALNYGISKNVITKEKDIYSFNSKALNIPLGASLLIKDGIVFIGTAISDIEAISKGQYKSVISKDMKNMLLKNNSTVFFNPRNLNGKFKEKEFGSKSAGFNDFFNKMGNITITSSGIKGNTISGELVAEVPAGNDNALKYIMSLIESVSKM